MRCNLHCITNTSQQLKGHISIAMLIVGSFGYPLLEEVMCFFALPSYTYCFGDWDKTALVIIFGCYHYHVDKELFPNITQIIFVMIMRFLLDNFDSLWKRILLHSFFNLSIFLMSKYQNQFYTRKEQIEELNEKVYCYKRKRSHSTNDLFSSCFWREDFKMDEKVKSDEMIAFQIEKSLKNRFIIKKRKEDEKLK